MGGSGRDVISNANLYLRGEIEENCEKCLESWSPGRDLNCGASYYEEEVLNTWLQRSFSFKIK
jgi:hypothetical protein